LFVPWYTGIKNAATMTYYIHVKDNRNKNTQWTKIIRQNWRYQKANWKP